MPNSLILSNGFRQTVSTSTKEETESLYSNPDDLVGVGDIEDDSRKEDATDFDDDSGQDDREGGETSIATIIDHMFSLISHETIDKFV